MKLSTYAIIVAIASFVYAVSLLFFPVQFIKNYGTTLDPGSTVIARLLGSSMFSYGIVYWINRNVPATDRAWSGLLWGSVIFNIVNLIIVVMAVTSGIGNSMNWSTAAINVIFALASLYFVTRKK